MTKIGKIGVIVCVLGVIVAMVVCASTMFTVKRVQMVWYTTNSVAMSKVTGEQILAASGVKNNSVFRLDRELAVSNLEKEFNAMRIIALEVVYPNVLKVHAVERQKVYAIPTEYGDYLITDEYLKVLDVVPQFNSENVNPVLLNIENMKNHYNIGDTVVFSRSSTFVEIYNAFFSLKQDLGHMMAIVKSIDYTNSKLTLHTHFDVDIFIENPTQNTQSKVRYALLTFDTLGSEDYGKVYIDVLLSEEGKLNSFIRDIEQ